MSGGPDLDDILGPYHLGKNQLEKIIETYQEEFEVGLRKGPPEATVAMLPSFVPELPDGTEKGRFLGVDLGGTNLRVFFADIFPGSPLKLTSKNYTVTEAAMSGTGEELFDFLAEKLLDFLTENGIENQSLSLGFVFSFPCDQTSLTDAVLLWWTKRYTCSNTLGRNVVKMFQDAIDRKGCLKVRVRAIMNDTVGQLVSAAYEHGPDCTIGAVVSTGCNASYLERIENIEKLNANKVQYKFPNMIIDTEWEEFGNSGQLDIIQTPMDRAVDLGSVHKGKQTQDKYISGLHIGELARLLLLEAEKSGACGLENDLLVGILSQRDTVIARHVSDVLRDDPRAGEFRFTKEVLKGLGYADPTHAVCVAVSRVCYVVSDRSAGVLAAALAALVRKMGSTKVKIGMGGTFYQYHSMYQRLLKQWLNRLLPLSVDWQLVFTEDGSAKGAVLVAAIAEKLDLK